MSSDWLRAKQSANQIQWYNSMLVNINFCMYIFHQPMIQSLVTINIFLTGRPNFYYLLDVISWHWVWAVKEMSSHKLQDIRGQAKILEQNRKETHVSNTYVWLNLSTHIFQNSLHYLRYIHQHKREVAWLTAEPQYWEEKKGHRWAMKSCECPPSENVTVTLMGHICATLVTLTFDLLTRKCYMTHCPVMGWICARYDINRSNRPGATEQTPPKFQMTCVSLTFLDPKMVQDTLSSHGLYLCHIWRKSEK